MRLTIITPEKELYSGDVQSVRLPGTSGSFQVLKGHASVVASLQDGDILVLTVDGEKLTFPVTQGFVEVLRNEVSVLIEALAGAEQQEAGSAD